MTAFTRAIVVGASSGIGAALVRELSARGCQVAALARRAPELQELRAACAGSPGQVLVRTHDVLDVEAVPALFEELVRELGGLDLFVYAAGVMPEIGAEEYDTRKDLDILAINTGGCIAWGNAVAELFHSQRGGTLVGISSIAGDRGRKGNPVYGTSKAAMNHYLEAVRNRLGVVGAHVCTIKPGYVDTAMTRGKGLAGVIPAEEAARLILRAARLRLNVWYVPFKWTLVGIALRSIPSFLFRRLNI